VVHAYLTLIPVGPGVRAAMAEVIEQLSPQFRGLPGFGGVTFLLNDPDDLASLYGWLSLWESRRDAEAAAAILAEPCRHAVREVASGPPTFRLFQVYEPRRVGGLEQSQRDGQQ
jgi:heme-degrading monooxygenase HmoA